MSATEDDTELRDLLIQNLENTGVLNKLKAEMRAAVFLAMEEQDKLESKTPLINENLKKSLNTSDGRLVASLILDFLQVFHLYFTEAVFQPELNSLNGLDSRDLVCQDLGLSDVNRNSPLLLELVRRGRHKDTPMFCPEEPSEKQIALACKKFDVYDKESSGSVLTEDVKNILTDLCPSLNKSMLERFVSDELRAADKMSSKAVDLQLFLGMYRRLFAQCRSVVAQDSEVSPCPEVKATPPLVSKDHVTSLADGQQTKSPDLDLDEDLDDGDSFFDDPLPKPQKTYGCLSVLAGDSEGHRDEHEQSQRSELRKVESSGPRESPAGSQSDAPRPEGGSTSEQNGASESRSRKDFRDSKAPNDRSGSLHLDDDVDYDDDFNSHRSEFSRSELSIGEEIEEVSIEGPDNSDKLDDSTQDLSVSQLSQSHGADYMEEVA
ncbi:centrosomal protein 43 isoform X2 [Echeneis naucrates]|uniref:centrosomal protein 43 isoform X2 n=1 Tax=Echeneis naucrates TaxID=173247 RepID=UPI001113AD31|nr:FGFR1 oncogene partner isoform X2 [Echeneis naucrates]